MASNDKKIIAMQLGEWHGIKLKKITKICSIKYEIVFGPRLVYVIKHIVG